MSVRAVALTDVAGLIGPYLRVAANAPSVNRASPAGCSVES